MPSTSGVEAGSYTYASMATRLEAMDTNQLQTALATAIAAEDYVLAARVRDVLASHGLRGKGGSAVALDWRALGAPEWLADRMERLQWPFPTEVQRRAMPVLQSRADAVITSQTGSGKSLAALAPALSFALDYPPALFPEDLDGPQLLVLVPTFELGVQACMLVYKLLGGNISARHPGDAANMFTFTGPRGIKVRGLLNEEEVEMAKQGQYLKGCHVVVATPAAALATATGPGGLPLFRDLKLLVCDEVDALLRDCPADTQQLLDMAVTRQEPDDGPVPGGSGSGDGGGSGAAGDEAGPSGRGEGTLQSGEGAARAAGPSAAAGAAWDVEDRMAQIQQALKRRSTRGISGIGMLSNPSSSSSSSSSSRAAALGSGETSSSGWGGISDGANSRTDKEAELAAELAAVDVAPLGKPQVVFVGATVSDKEVELALNRGWMVDPVEVAVGQPDRVPRGLRHRVVVAEGARRLAVLTRMLRCDLEAGSADAAPARAIVFAASEAEARFAADPLRSALWSQHALSVLLPGGAEPVKALTAFRDRAASLLLATPTAARGLDLPAVSHVYNLGPPPNAAEYLHRAGRSGRVGSTTGGIVTSIVTEDELPHLHAVCDELGLHLEVEDDITSELAEAAAAAAAAGGAADDAEPVLGQQAALGEEQLGKLRRGLEDLYNLM